MTQETRLLARLKQGPLTKLEGINQLGIINVGGRILDLRNKGVKIKTTMMPVVNRFREKGSIAVYELER